MKIESDQSILRGIAASTGAAIGKIYKYEAYQPEIKRQYSEDTKREIARYAQAKAAAEVELRAIVASLASSAPDKADIFTAHIDILLDEEIGEQVNDCICEKNQTAEFAVQNAYGICATLFDQMDDPLLRERKADFSDVSLRVLRNLEGKQEKSISSLPSPVIVAAYDLLPSDTATLDRNNVLGILTEAGNVTSHTAIIARNYGIPAILGIPTLMKNVTDGMPLVMDADEGLAYLHPTDAMIGRYGQKKQEQHATCLRDQAYLKKALKTADGVRILIGANIGAPGKDMKANAEDVDCVGLFRTEFLYMESTHSPTEAEQFEVYQSVLQAYGGKPVLLRTIDIGGDKSLSYMDLPKEDNPFLGVRALRLCYEQPELFKTQLRAALRASLFGKLELMFPMVTSMEDIRWAKSMLQEVGAELDAAGIGWDKDIPVGIMMEVPSIMMIADQVAQEVDFASVGTNDLCQYLTASDRLNPGTSRYYQSFHPAMFRLMDYTTKAFAKQNKSVSVCGEMGGDPFAAPVLVGLGMRKLSMNHSAVAKIKHLLSERTIQEMEILASEVLRCGTDEEVRRAIKAAMARP